MNTTYDIEAAFERIEDLLISNMKTNLTRHLNEEQLNQLTWTQWQTLQTDALKEFRKANPKLFKKEFEEINKKVEEMLRDTYNTAATSTENELLKHYVGQRAALSAAEQLERHRIHEDKLNALINETTGNFKNAESAILRKSDDVYRKIIFDSQIYLNSGSGTLTQAIDMATKDFLSQGLNCIEYKNGDLVNISSYSEMALRTANTRATLQGEASKRDEWGEPLVMITYRSSACPKCVRYIGKVFVDDVWGTSRPKSGNKYPLLSSAIAGGLYHPNCKDSHTTFFEGITQQRTMTPEEEEEAVRRYDLQQKQRYNERQIRKYKRLENGSISEENKIKYAKKRKEWQSRNNEFVKAHDDVLRRDYSRERVRVQDISRPPESALAASTPTPKKSTFTPATNRSEALELLRGNGIAYVEIDNMLDGQLIPVSNKMVELSQKYNTNNRYQLSSFFDNGNKRGSCSIMMPHFNDNDISLKRIMAKNGESVLKLKKNIEIKYNMPIFESNYKYYDITHEFGHSIQNDIISKQLSNDKYVKYLADNRMKYNDAVSYSRLYTKMSSDMRADITKIFAKKSGGSNINGFLSDYAKTDSFEFFAEVFTKMELGEIDDLTESMREYLQNFYNI